MHHAHKSGHRNNGTVIGDSLTYVSRGAYKLDSVAAKLNLHFKGKTVLDVGASTGGFSDYALKHGAIKVIAVDKGTKQINPLLATDPALEIHEKTDIRDFKPEKAPDLILADVSFMSLTEILPAIAQLANADTEIIVLAKPQFETRDVVLKHKGVIKNERIRRQILSGLEMWFKRSFVIKAKADSGIVGTHGNKERFYLLKLKQIT
jgi:23S rRNA (cytidine1920-2'-O)/16S rRNA (cytidine1409-2'-O)-methyltransferase